MNNYFSQFVPNLPFQSSTTPPYTPATTSTSPKINYITIYNPSLSPPRAESNEELLKQILCFISEDGTQFQSVQQLRTIGLIRGIDSFARTFTEDPALNEPSIINSTNSSIIIHHLESDYYVACSISHNKKSTFVNQQMIRLIEEAYHIFVLLNTSFANIYEKYTLEILQHTLSEFWWGFLDNYNSQGFSYPVGLQWSNRINYKGFLGLIKAQHKYHEPTYKKSSLSLNLSTQTEINQLLDPKNLPLGLIISNFNKTSPKNYGLMYMNCDTTQLENTDATLHQQMEQLELIRIYNWLEFHDYHGKLNTESLTNIDNKKVFSTKRETPESDGTPADGMSLRSTVNALGMLPINLVATPLNYTMNMMKGREENERITKQRSPLRANSPKSGERERESQNSPQISEETSQMPSYISPQRSTVSSSSTPVSPYNPAGWLSLPPLLKNFSVRDEPVPEPIPELVSESEDEEEHGQFLIGLKDENNDKVIHRKLIYLPTKDKDGQIQFYEYLLIIYTKYDINCTLIFNSSHPKLDDFDFYNELERDLEPALDEIQNSVFGGSLIGSIGSLKSHNGSVGSIKALLQDTEDFFFVIFDSTEGWIKSSLPYLSDSPDKLNHESAIFHLHDQLSTLFLMQKNQDFFSDHEMSEYFHKFTSNRLNDWMFYYIKHDKKFIIIIKNHNKKRRRTVVDGLKSVKRKSVIPEEVPVDQTLFNRLTNGVHDYASLGFLDNLGDDVRSWLEGFGERGET